MPEPKEEFDSLRLEEQLCFPLYAAEREMRSIYRPLLDEIGLTYTQYLVMLVLWEHGEKSVKELGGLLCLDSGTLTPVLKSLEAKGLVTRKKSTEDERVVTASPTESGTALRSLAADIPSRIKGSLALDEAEAFELYRLLYKILGIE